MNTTIATQRAALLRLIAVGIRNTPPNAGLFADALDVIADAMEPCTDCGHPEPDDMPGLMHVTGTTDTGV